MHLFTVGVNHTTAPVSIREHVAFQNEQLGQALRDLTAHQAVHEAAILSTCNRTELYCNTEDPQVALNWLLQRPTVSTVLVGARNEAQLRQNLGAVGWSLSPEQVARLDAASAMVPPYPYYPYWNGQFAERNPPPVPVAGAHA